MTEQLTKERCRQIRILLSAMAATAVLAIMAESVFESLFERLSVRSVVWDLLFGKCLIPKGGVIGTAVFAAAVLLIFSLRYPGAARPLAATAWGLLTVVYLLRSVLVLYRLWWESAVQTTPSDLTAAHRTAIVDSGALILLFLLLAVCALCNKPAPANAVCALIGISALLPVETLLHAADTDAAPLLMGPAASMHGLLLGALWVRYGSRRALPDALLWGALAALLLRTVVPIGGEYPLPYPSSAGLSAQATAWLTAAGILTVLIGRYCAGRAGRAGHIVRAAGYGVTAAGLLAYAVGALSVLPTIEGAVRAAGLCCLAAAAIGQEVFLVSPLQAAGTLVQLLPQPDFWQRVGFSAGHILLGFLLGAVCSVVCSVAAERWVWVGALLSPVVQLVKATPVASFIILALVWVSGKSLSILISFLMVLPVLYGAVRTGIESADPQLLEMARVFRLPLARRVKAIWLPAVLPAFRQGCSVALGICWKSGVAAEVIGLPDGSIGDALYRAKITLSTGELFAWTFVIILLSAAFEKLFLALLDKAVARVLGEEGANA